VEAWQVMCDTPLGPTRAIMSALEASSHAEALYKCHVFNFFFFIFNSTNLEIRIHY